MPRGEGIIFIVHSYSFFLLLYQVFLSNTNNLHTVVCFQVFQSNINLYTIIGLQVIISI